MQNLDMVVMLCGMSVNGPTVSHDKSSEHVVHVMSAALHITTDYQGLVESGSLCPGMDCHLV